MLRVFLRFILITMTLGFSSALAAEENSNEIKAVYDLKTGDSKTLERSLISGVMKNSVYYQNQLQELKVKVVIHGDSYKFFQKESKMAEIAKKLKSLHESYGVEFEICKAGLKKKQHSRAEHLSFCQNHPKRNRWPHWCTKRGICLYPDTLKTLL